MVFIYGTLTSDCTDLFIEVHPRHAGFYQAMLGFQTVGEAGVNVSVGAPSQLMQLGVGEIGARIAAAAPGAKTSSQHSLYPHFFPALEEAEIRSAAVLNAMRSRLQSKPLRRTDMRTIRGDLVRRGSTAAASATDLYLPRPGTLDALQAPGRPDVSCAA